MTWADELFEKKRVVKCPLIIGGTTYKPDRLMKGNYYSEDDLTSAVLEKNKEIEFLREQIRNKKSSFIATTFDREKEQARAFRELVEKAEKRGKE